MSAGPPWFRLYHEFANDPVVQCLAFDDQRHFVMLLCMKCAGTLDKALPSEQTREMVIAKGLGLDLTSAREAKRRLCEVNLIAEDWQPIAWDARQFESDTSTDRVRKHREKERRRKELEALDRRAAAETGDETLPKRSSNGPEQSREEQNREGARARARASPDEFKTVPAGWRPAPETEAWIREQRFAFDVAHETAKFHQHEFRWPITDLNAALRKWLLMAVDIHGSAHPAPESRTPAEQAAALERLAARARDEGLSPPEPGESPEQYRVRLADELGLRRFRDRVRRMEEAEPARPP